MKSNILRFIFPVFCLTVSCTEIYQLPDLGSQTTIVITGLITNEPGPYYVKVLENVSDISTGTNIQKGINDARVTITDGKGHVDELRSFFSVPMDSVLVYSGISYYGIPEEEWEYTWNIPDGNGGSLLFTESLFYQGEKGTDFVNYTSQADIRQGAYFTTSTRGEPGNTYTLNVNYAGQQYTATDKMSYGTVLDSVSIEPIGRFIPDKPDGTDGFLVPCLYFSEPRDEVNFYMFTRSAHWPMGTHNPPLKDLVIGKSIFFQSGTEWKISVVSDRFMPPYVYQYKMSDGDYSGKRFNDTDMGFWFENWELGGIVNMYCITEPAYRYYFALSQQFYEDGGAFSPSPASPPTNIGGGAQGCFSAASVSQYIFDLRF
ncbi:MAG: DUF4249 domain-containing protein [Tannerella sp.]|jgi:hypothetical protein|nr:DUF4249 domain-containing protein [Tannerella sp.]